MKIPKSTFNGICVGIARIVIYAVYNLAFLNKNDVSIYEYYLFKYKRCFDLLVLSS